VGVQGGWDGELPVRSDVADSVGHGLERGEWIKMLDKHLSLQSCFFCLCFSPRFSHWSISFHSVDESPFCSQSVT
jgi:hypothetical protein